MTGALKKVGWTWTARQGWKRIPRRLRTVKLVPVPKKRKTRKLRRISPAAPKPEKPDMAEAPKLTVEQGRADSALLDGRGPENSPRASRRRLGTLNQPPAARGSRRKVISHDRARRSLAALSELHIERGQLCADFADVRGQAAPRLPHRMRRLRSSNGGGVQQGKGLKRVEPRQDFNAVGRRAFFSGRSLPVWTGNRRANDGATDQDAHGG
jgi:hypothetical protein